VYLINTTSYENHKFIFLLLFYAYNAYSTRNWLCITGSCTVRWENKTMYCIVSVFGLAFWNVYPVTLSLHSFFLIVTNEQILFEVVNLLSSWSLNVAFNVAYWCICCSFWYLQFVFSAICAIYGLYCDYIYLICMHCNLILLLLLLFSFLSIPVRYFKQRQIPLLQPLMILLFYGLLVYNSSNWMLQMFVHLVWAAGL